MRRNATSALVVVMVVVVITLAGLPPTATAFPFGAGSCDEGTAKFPPDSQHVNAGAGEIADSGFLSVMIGTVDLDEGIVGGEGEVQFTPVGICTGENNLCAM